MANPHVDAIAGLDPLVQPLTEQHTVLVPMPNAAPQRLVVSQFPERRLAWTSENAQVVPTSLIAKMARLMNGPEHWLQEIADGGPSRIMGMMKVVNNSVVDHQYFKQF